MTHYRTVFEPIGWGMLRAPLLPVIEDDQALDRSDVRLALEIASEQLASEFERSTLPAISPRANRNQERLTRAIWSYITRMRFRATPFGLCAGVSLVSWGPKTDVSVVTGTLSASARADMGWMAGIIGMLEGDDRVRRQLRWVTNPAAVEQDGRIYLSEKASGPLPRPGVSIQATPAALAVLGLASCPTSYRALVDAVLRRPSATVPRAERMVDELCRQSFLICELWTIVHDPDPLTVLLGFLSRSEVATEVGPALADLRRQADYLAAFDTEPTVERYRRAVGSARRILPRSGGTNKAGQRSPRDTQELQVDGLWKLGGVELHHDVATAAAEAAELLLRFGLMPDGPSHLAAWRRDFLRRYGSNTAVPVPIAIDPGVGLGPPVQDRTGGGRRQLAGLARRDALLYRLAVAALKENRMVVELDDALVERLTNWRPADRSAPEDVDIIMAVAAESAEGVNRGEFTCVISPAVGAPGAGKVTGRFAHLLGPAALRDLPGAEDRRAEVFFRPASDRLLNVTLRPNRTGWVIPVGVPPPSSLSERVILPKDILVCVAEDRLRLVTREGRTVTPVATHMLTWSRIPELARFLLDVPRDGCPVLSRFSWGSAASLPVLPRLQRGRIVLSPARWQCDCSEVTTEMEFDRWRDRWAPPGLCYLADSNNRLLIDLDDPNGRQMVLDSLVRRRRSVQLEEALPGPADAWLPGPDGPRLVELAVPLRRKATPSRPPGAANRHYRPWTQQDREAAGTPPGTEWLFLKLYIPREASDTVLARDVAPLLCQIEQEHLAETWFFIRYHDPAAHLRLRWRQRNGSGPILGQVVLSWAHDLQRSGRVERVVVDRYEREVARYGGVAAVDIAERIFAADSSFVLGLLELEARRAIVGNGQVFADRTELAAVTLHRLMADLGVEGNWASFYKTLSGGERAAGRVYRERQKQLRELVADVRSDPELEALLTARSGVVTAAAAELERLAPGLTHPIETIKQSYAHMHLNRIIGPARSHEQFIYGLLERTSRSLAESPLTLSKEPSPG
jgi:lantibiotic biosynthesis protein